MVPCSLQELTDGSSVGSTRAVGVVGAVPYVTLELLNRGKYGTGGRGDSSPDDLDLSRLASARNVNGSNTYRYH